MSTMRAPKIWVWALVVVVAYAAVAACDRPENSNDYFDRGVDRLKAGKYEGAIADFDQAINIRPKYTDAYIKRADAKIRLGQYKEAIVDYDQAIRLQPDNAPMYVNRSVVKAELGQHQEAIADLESALDLAREAGDSDLIIFIEGKIEELEQDE